MIKYITQFCFIILISNLLFCNSNELDDLVNPFDMFKEMNDLLLNQFDNNFKNDIGLDVLNNSNSNKNKKVKRVVTTNKNGVETVQVTETFMDNGPGVMIPITTVVVTKKNLKTGGSLPKANPFRIFADIDSMFEAMLDDIISSSLINTEHNHMKIINSNNNDEDEDHPDHIKINGIRDINPEEKDIESKEEPKEKINLEEIIKEVNEEIKTEEELNKKKLIEEHHDENQVMIKSEDIGIKHEGDNVMSSKDKKKQIIEDRKKNSVYTKIIKFLTYAIIFVIFLFISWGIYRKLKLENINNEGCEMKTPNTKND